MTCQTAQFHYSVRLTEQLVGVASQHMADVAAERRAVTERVVVDGGTVTAEHAAVRDAGWTTVDRRARRSRWVAPLRCSVAHDRPDAQATKPQLAVKPVNKLELESLGYHVALFASSYV